MDINQIASLSTALSTAKVQNEVSMKVLKIAQGQQQVAADLIASAVETAAEISKQIGDTGANIDITA